MSPAKFAQLLTAAIHKIRLHEAKTTKKTIQIVQDELGYALGRDGGSCIEYWRKGHIPAEWADLTTLDGSRSRRAQRLLLMPLIHSKALINKDT